MQAFARRAAWAAVAVLLVGCAAAPEAPETSGPIYFPPPPEPARYVYQARIQAPDDIQREQDKDGLQRLLVGQSQPEVVFGKPYGIAARGGRIYISDTEKRLVHAFDLPRRRYFSLGYRFEGKLQKPLGMALDHLGQLYVADAGRKQVIVFDGLGLFIRAIGESGDLERPTSVAVNGEGSRVYVVDTGGVTSDRHRVVVYDGQGVRLGEFGGRGGEDGQFNLPLDAAVAPDGTLYVLDSGNFRVQVFGPDGEYLRSWGEVGKGFGQLARPRGLAVDIDGNVLVSDAFFGNLQIFTNDGRLLLSIGSIGTEDRPGRYRLIAGVASDEAGRLYLVDQYAKKVEVFSRAW